MNKVRATATLILFAIAAAQAQAPPQTPPGAPAAAGAQGGRGGRGGGGGGGFGGAYPQHPQESPEVIARGKAIYGAQCNFCHGSDARGGEGGPNLLRSQTVLKDSKGETIAPVIQNGRPDQGMPKFDLSAAQIADVAGFLHSFRVGGYDPARERPASILVGDAKAGEAYFKSKCGSCHSVTGDLKAFGAKFQDPKQLQQTWLMPGGGRGGFGGGGGPSPVNVPPTTVTVTMASGQKVEGRLGRIDDFIVTLTEADGTPRTIQRDGDIPKVEIHEPLKPHRELLPVYTDKDIHNVTAYLVTVK
jgi:cytochrome c oxidase cbb3-type subunit 3